MSSSFWSSAIPSSPITRPAESTWGAEAHAAVAAATTSAGALPAGVESIAQAIAS